jgi:hypothetical protein
MYVYIYIYTYIYVRIIQLPSISHKKVNSAFGSPTMPVPTFCKLDTGLPGGRLPSLEVEFDAMFPGLQPLFRPLKMGIPSVLR